MRVLFLGEGELDGSARYLAAILRWSKIAFDHRPDRTPIPSAWQKRRYDAFVLSDYRASNLSRTSTHWIEKKVAGGAGFLMIGGWASFTGLVGGYAGHPLEDVLPVRCFPGDDRVNRSALLDGIRSAHPIVVNGYHRVKARPGSTTELFFQELTYSSRRLATGSRRPALVRGTFGMGRTAAFMTDCAPHWAGGLVDWGRRRITVRLPGRVSVELGEGYLRFFRHLIESLGNPCKSS